jgi:hypothetical protein
MTSVRARIRPHPRVRPPAREASNSRDAHSRPSLLSTHVEAGKLATHRRETSPSPRSPQKYGPALGLSRMERWDRAEKLNLSPPADVRRILEERKDDAAFAECVWERLV